MKSENRILHKSQTELEFIGSNSISILTCLEFNSNKSYQLRNGEKVHQIRNRLIGINNPVLFIFLIKNCCHRFPPLSSLQLSGKAGGIFRRSELQIDPKRAF
jgi:hypothetical protein